MVKTGQRIIMAGGGTGGHIFPAIAIANAIKKLDGESEILFVGARGKMEMEKVPQAGFKIKGITIAGFNRSSLIKNIGLPVKLIRSFFQVASVFSAFRPTAVVGVGGYSSFPVLRYAQWKKIPTFIHEANSFGGKSNMMLSRKAVKVFTATDGMEKFFPLNKIKVTGNPVRQSILNGEISKTEAVRFFGLEANKETVLCVGGSLGARSINDAIASGINMFEQNGLQLIWQTGKPYFETARQKVEGFKNVFVSDFISSMENAYAAADVVVSRSGAMAISELCVVRKPVVLVPYPYAAEDHQTANAMNLVNKNAAIIIKDSEAAEKLLQEVIKTCKDKGLQQRMSENIGKLAVTNADKVVAEEIYKML